MSKLRFAVAGTGWVAGEYLKVITANPNTEVYSVVSQHREFAQDRLAFYGIEAPVLSSFEEAVKDPNVDAVVLCSTPDIRPGQAELAAQYGKHLVIEKPVAMDRAGLFRMAEAIDKNNVHGTVSFVGRLNPTNLNAKTLVEDDAIGRVFMAQIDYWHHVGPQYGQYRWSKTRELGGSSILSAGCHAVDALRYIAGDVTEVTAYSCRTWADSEYEFDPNTIAIFKLKNGGMGKVSSSLECKTPYIYNIHLLGEKGSIMNNQLFSHKLPGQTDYATIPTKPRNGDVADHAFKEEIASFVHSVLNNTPSFCEFADAYKTMEACFAIEESIISGNKVLLP